MNDEKELIYNINAARSNLAHIKHEIAKLNIASNQAEQTLERAELALIAYMQETGQVAFESGEMEITLKDSYTVDVADINAVPEAYIRSKVVREPDKQKIRNERPAGANWYIMNVKPTVMIKMKG